jgi:hypothetical protein
LQQLIIKNKNKKPKYCNNFLLKEMTLLDATEKLILNLIIKLNCYSLLLGTPTGAALDLLSTDRDSCFTASLGRWRGLLSHSPPSTTNVVPLTYFPYSIRHAHKILSLWATMATSGKKGKKKQRRKYFPSKICQKFQDFPMLKHQLILWNGVITTHL